LSIVEEKKRLLTHYASLINKVIEPFNATIFEILWARDRCGQELGSNLEHVGQLMLPNVVQYTRTQFTKAEHFLSIYGQHLAVVLGSCNSLDRHSWGWIMRPLSFEEEARALNSVEEFRSTLRRAAEHCDHLQETGGITLTWTAAGLEQAASTLAFLPQPNVSIIEGLLAPCQIASTRRKLAEFVEHLSTFHGACERLSSFTSNVSSLHVPQTTDRLRNALECLRRWGLDGHSIVETKNILILATETVKLLQEAQSSFRVLLGVI